MKILSGEQVRAADAHTIASQKISSDELMERAGQALFEWLHAQLNGSPVSFIILCGIGNNGGDGLVLARHLVEHGYEIQVYVVNYSDKRSEDFLINLDRLKDRKIWPQILKEDSLFPDIPEGSILIDAIFGTGLNRKPDPWVSRLIQHINSCKATVVSVDIPSGMFTDRNSDENHVVHAGYVLTFQSPKLVFFLPSTGPFCGEWVSLDIGLDEAYLAQLDTEYVLVEFALVRSLYRFRNKFTHKGTYGHAVVIGGSYGKIGAVQLSARACLSSGSGLVTVFIPECGYSSMQGSLPEIMVLTDRDDRHITGINLPFQPAAVGIGMGMGTSERSSEAFAAFLKGNSAPLVVDADGLNILSRNNALLKLLPPQTILSPHPGELERLIGPWKDDFEKLEKAREFTRKYDLVLIIKGAHTLVLNKDKGYVNSTGNPGMATAGSGDVLTGVITGILSQGYPPLHAALMGVYLHGRAGDICLLSGSMESLTASEIIANLGNAFREYYPQENSGEEGSE